MSFSYSLTPLSSFGFGYPYPSLASSFGFGTPFLHSTPFASYFPNTEFLTIPPAPAASPTTEFKSQIEQAILNSSDPISTTETALVNANGNTGIFLNKSEADKWKGDLPLSEYKLNEDPCPTVLFKKPSKCVNLTKKHTIKYLKPPPAPKPGDIVIKQEANIPTAPAPPVIIRQVPLKPCSPEPLVIREKPPCLPAPVCKKEIVLPGKKLAPAPRRVVIEKLPLLPFKPQPVVVERWLPYEKQERRVIFQKAPPDPCPEKPKNLIIQWEPPCVCIKEQYKNLGVQAANPAEYVAKYGASLKSTCELPKFALDMKPTDGSDPNACPAKEHKLVGDLNALNLIDLDKEGLGIYKKYLNQSSPNCSISPSASNSTSAAVASASAAASASASASASAKPAETPAASSPLEKSTTTLDVSPSSASGSASAPAAPAASAAA